MVISPRSWHWRAVTARVELAPTVPLLAGAHMGAFWGGPPEIYNHECMCGGMAATHSAHL